MNTKKLQEAREALIEAAHRLREYHHQVANDGAVPMREFARANMHYLDAQVAYLQACAEAQS